MKAFMVSIRPLVLSGMVLWASGFGLFGCVAEYEPNCGNFTQVSLTGDRLTPAFGTGRCTSQHRADTFYSKPAVTYWLAPGEPVCVYWDLFDVSLQVPDKVDVTGHCELCSECDEKLSDGSDFRGFTFTGGIVPHPTGPQVRIAQTQLPAMNVYEQIAAFGWRTGCIDNQGVPYPSVTLANESIVRLGIEAWSGGGSDTACTHAVGHMAFFVSVPDMDPNGFAIPIQLLEKEPDFNEDDPDYVYRVKEVDEGIYLGRWEHEFSTSLSITRIRIFRGTFKYNPKDPGKNPKFDLPPRTWLLENISVVRPKRIELDMDPPTDFRHSCDGDKLSPDGDFDLSECRKIDDGRIIRISQPRATPRYGVLVDGPELILYENLNWTIKFDSDANNPFYLKPLAQDERLAIEFTLKVN